MTQDIGQTIKEMTEIEFPAGLHGKILRQILFLRFRTPFLVIVTLLVGNLLFSGIRIWQRILDSEGLATLGLLWETLEFSFKGGMQFAHDAYDVLPIGYIGLFLVNLLVFLYVAFYVPRAFNRMASRKPLTVT